MPRRFGETVIIETPASERLQGVNGNKVSVGTGEAVIIGEELPEVRHGLMQVSTFSPR
jgi:hypothetical protein